MKVTPPLERCFPAHLDLLKSADHGFNWAGLVPLTQFVRLADIDALVKNNKQVDVNCSLQVDDKRIVWFEMDASVTLQIPCYRCLQLVDLPLHERARFAVLTDDSFCDRLNSSDDFVILGEETLVHGGDKENEVNVLALIEDELLLALPRAVRHDSCVSIIEETEVVLDAEPQDNPFDVLAQLKTK